LIRDFFLGFIRIHVLHHAAVQPVYGLWLIEELGHHGYALSPGTLYPILRDLTRGGYLRLDKRLVSGRIRKYYGITAHGRRALDSAQAQITELVGEVLERRPRRATRPLPRRRASATRRPGRDAR
jgi:PadR family transcriptional regulator, regulatory protein PadR